MGEEDRKTEKGSSWYKGWFVLLQPDSPLVTQSGVYGLETLKNPDSITLRQNTLVPSMEDLEKPPGVYTTQHTLDKIKFKYQVNLVSELLASERYLILTDGDGWKSFKKSVARKFNGREVIYLDYAKLSFKNGGIAYVVLGINYNNSITMKDYEEVIQTTDEVEAVLFARKHLHTKNRKETSKEDKDLNTHDINLV